MKCLDGQNAARKKARQDDDSQRADAYGVHLTDGFVDVTWPPENTAKCARGQQRRLLQLKQSARSEVHGERDSQSFGKERSIMRKLYVRRQGNIYKSSFSERFRVGEYSGGMRPRAG